MWTGECAKIVCKFALQAIPTRWEILVRVSMRPVRDVVILADVGLCFQNHSWGLSWRILRLPNAVVIYKRVRCVLLVIELNSQTDKEERAGIKSSILR